MLLHNLEILIRFYATNIVMYDLIENMQFKYNYNFRLLLCCCDINWRYAV
jgi:hypothetical protein